ncbi:MAG: hypothetical protein V2B18_25480, partial [Pseudomonadota bacterium]
MSSPAPWFRPTLALIAIGFIALFVLIDRRNRDPEWEKYQVRGRELALERLEKDIAAEADPERRKKLTQEQQVIRSMSPRVIEVRPFDGKLGTERCLTCHFGIEDTSPAHPNSVFGCVICHGGNGPDLTVAGAHLGLRGGRNPSRLEFASVSCGRPRGEIGSCHSEREDHLLNRADNVPRSLMATNRGIFSVLRFQWGLTDGTTPKYGIRPVSDGKTQLEAIPPEYEPNGDFNLAASHFRKFCAVCHLWTSSHREVIGRSEGCAACHADYGSGKYQGGDPTVKRDEPGHAARHTLTNRISNDRCRACHNRSARVGLNYHGEMESAQYGTPFMRGGLNDATLSDDRFVLRLVPDVHHEKGMGCIDCHTGQDTMGDGTIHAHMEDQIEIRCEDCHGTESEHPKAVTVGKHDPFIRTIARSSPFLKISEGDRVFLTSKGRPMPHVRLTPKGAVLTSKVTGKEHPVSVIAGKKTHGIRGHERLECDACHSAWSPQCYGCHQVLDFRHNGLDHLSKKETPGRWAEGRGYFRYAR